MIAQDSEYLVDNPTWISEKDHYRNIKGVMQGMFFTNMMGVISVGKEVRRTVIYKREMLNRSALPELGHFFWSCFGPIGGLRNETV